MHRRTGVAILVILSLAALSSVGWATAAVLGSSSFNTNGSYISGWYWLRTIGHQATWILDTSQMTAAKPGSAYINMQALVTNGMGGGSGYETSAKMQIFDVSDKLLVSYSLYLKNPFRPVDPANSGGLGYITYGFAGPLSDKIIKGHSQLKIVTAFPFANSRHVAVNKDSVTLGYSR